MPTYCTIFVFGTQGAASNFGKIFPYCCDVAIPIDEAFAAEREPVNLPGMYPPDGICEKIAVVPFGAYHVDVDAHVVQLRDSCVVYPSDMLRNLAADVACVIKHHFRKHHPVEWFVMFEGKENCCDTILAK